MLGITRREFITLAGSAAACPLAAYAQQPTIPTVGYLYSGAAEASARSVAEFRRGLSEVGYVEGRDLAIEYRFANNDSDGLSEMAAELVRRGVAVIAATSLPAALAAKAATTTIPIIFQIAGDPVQIGLVASFNRPGGNLTGISSLSTEVMGKRLGLLHELVPKATRFAALLAEGQNAEFNVTELRSAASVAGLHIELSKVSTNRDIDLAFTDFKRTQADALIVGPGALLSSSRIQVLMLATHHRIPAIYTDRIYADTGGLVTYGTNLRDQARQVGIYSGRILKGEKPSELPVMRAAKFELIINLRTARMLGVTIPPTLLATADEVIE